MKVPATVLRALRDAARHADVPLDLLAAIVYEESGFNPLAVGANGSGVSLGLGQASLSGIGAAFRREPWRLLVPESNAEVCAAHLAACLGAFPGDVARAVSAYDQGIERAQRERWWQVNGSSYMQPVLAHLERIQREGLEEDFDPDVDEEARRYGKTWRDVFEVLQGKA